MRSKATKWAVCWNCCKALQSCIICANTIQEVRISTISITIFTDHVWSLLIFHVFCFPFAVVVVAPRILQLGEQNFIFVNDSSKTSDPICPIKRCIGVETLWLFAVFSSVGSDRFTWLGTHQSLPSSWRRPIFELITTNIERWFEIDLQHFPEQYSVLILDFLKTFSFL